MMTLSKLFLFVALCTFATSTTTGPPSTHPAASLISVIGEGIIKAPPDAAVVKVGVISHSKKTAREALDCNNKDMARIIKELKALGIAEKDIQTSNLNLYPEEDRGDRKHHRHPKIIGYNVSNEIKIHIRDLKLTGKVLDKIVDISSSGGGGVNNLNSLQFINSNQSTLLQRARYAAVKDARVKAETILSALKDEGDDEKISLGKIDSINEGGTTSSQFPRIIRPVPPVMRQQQQIYDGSATYSSSSLSSSSVVPLEGGENSYRVIVDISWEINQNV